MISAIVAVNNDWGIGYNGDLLEHIPEDLKYFKELTSNNWVVMGRKTWNSLPKKPLPNRKNLVITNNPIAYDDTNEVNFFTLNQIELFMSKNKNLTFFIIGGGSIYQQLLPFCDRVYVTKIYKSHENVDTYFPNLDEQEGWIATPVAPPQDYKDLTYQFWQYDRI